MAYDSVATWRLYSAEGHVRQPGPSSVPLARTLVAKVTGSAWWRLLPDKPTVRVVVGGREVGGMVSSHITPDVSELLPLSWTLSLHPERATERTVLHELAHTITARLAWDDRRQPVAVSPHGPGFAGAYVELLGRFATREDPAALLDALVGFGVTWEAPEVWRQGTADSLRVEQALAAAGVDPPTFVQPFSHQLAAARRALGWTQKHLSAVAGCTPVQVGRLERSYIGAPGGRDADAALRAAAAVGMDPILMIHQHGFPRPNPDTIRHLRTINPGWAGLLDQMDDLTRRMPPYWETPGG